MGVGELTVIIKVPPREIMNMTWLLVKDKELDLNLKELDLAQDIEDAIKAMFRDKYDYGQIDLEIMVVE